MLETLKLSCWMLHESLFSWTGDEKNDCKEIKVIRAYENEIVIIHPCIEEFRTRDDNRRQWIRTKMVTQMSNIRRQTRRLKNEVKQSKKMGAGWSSWRCPWCNGYRHRIWTRRYEFNSWTRLIAFHIALIPLGKVWIQLFSLQLWVNSSYLPNPFAWAGYDTRSIFFSGV